MGRTEYPAADFWIRGAYSLHGGTVTPAPGARGDRRPG